MIMFPEQYEKENALRHLIEIGPVYMWLVLSMHINWWIILLFLILLAENKT